MSKPSGFFARAASLLLLALAAGVGWRAEVAWHGWGGLKWLTYTHLAVPAASASYIVWACTVAELPPRRRFLLGALLGMYAAVLGPLVHQVLAMTEAAGPGAIFVYVAVAEAFGNATRGVVALWTLRWLVLAAVPAGTAVLGRVAGVGVRLEHAALGIALFQLSWPLATWLLAVTGHAGGADTVHALKSGFVVPPMVVAMGLPFLRPGQPRRPLRHAESG